MNSVPFRELRSRSATVREALAQEKELVVTSNDLPVAVLCAVTASTLDPPAADQHQQELESGMRGDFLSP